MILLGIESSCDDTSIALVEDGKRVLSSIVSSQIDIHKLYGGVVPELAAREHLVNLRHTYQACLEQAKIDPASIDAIAVTAFPGLLPALLVGTSFANGVGAALGVPVLGVHHLVAHVCAVFLDHNDLAEDRSRFPILALLVSGGHSQLMKIDWDGSITILGRTLDDAAGEAFDKAAKALGLPYPGGPIVDRLAKTGNPEFIKFPRARLDRDKHRFDFSFSGLKTSMLTQIKGRTIADDELPDLLASYQAAIVDALVDKTLDAARYCGARSLALCGGVACNSSLRAHLGAGADKMGLKLHLASPKHCTDNGAMIAGLGWYQLLAAGPNPSRFVEASASAPGELRIPFLR